MARLTVTNFSCIDSAALEIHRLTVVIGPQASGKSVLSKLIFFFNDITSRQFIWIEDEKPYTNFISALADDFKKWFPPSAWGSQKFKIQYEMGPLRIDISRRGTKQRPTDEILISVSDLFSELYENGLRHYRRAKARSSTLESDDAFVDHEYESMWRIRSMLEGVLESAVGEDYTRTQTFVPAGRSFFTSIGKAIAAFDQSGMLDPVTVRFGRLFAAHRERNQARLQSRRITPEERNRQADAVRTLFGGRIRIERDNEYVETTDGRKIPFHILSSGQQELLPLWMVIGIAPRKSAERRIIYIEEPEAHLFPTAQSLVVEYLASLLSDNAPGRRMLITTHSPYVLSKINNLVLAGGLAAKHKEAASAVEEIVPRVSWLRPRHVKAYAIVDGKLTSIIDDDGLIDAEYLDGVSSDISREFSRLLELEVSL